MKQIQDEADIKKMLIDENAVLFIFVDWSAYARHGSQMVKETESKFATNFSNEPVSWWFVDCSHADSPSVATIHNWLVEQDSKSNLSMFPNIAAGHGSVV